MCQVLFFFVGLLQMVFVVLIVCLMNIDMFLVGVILVVFGGVGCLGGFVLMFGNLGFVNGLIGGLFGVNLNLNIGLY